IDDNRLEQELIFYLEKLDITEEKVRLKHHCTYFTETCNETKSNGKKLIFIAQEIGREINTIGSKANEINIQKIVVQMKDELEKIKEQLLNIL
ncbi:endoribonuclease YicC domain-containing protein, partial [Bacteroidota bacterium]